MFSLPPRVVRPVLCAAALLLAHSSVHAGVLFLDNFSGNSGGVPSGWTNIGGDPVPSTPFVESGGTLTATDGANNGPQLILSPSVSLASDFTLNVSLNSVTSYSGSHPVPMAGIGSLGNVAFLVQLNTFNNTFTGLAVYQGAVSASFTFPGTLSSYSGGALTLSLAFTTTGVQLTASSGSYDSGLVTYAFIEGTGLNTIDDFGSSGQVILGVDGGQGVPTGTLASATYDSVNVTTTVPEPTSCFLMVAAGALFFSRRKR